ncbi:hypothetical protein OXV68_16585, partial [Bacteroides fragilis]|nr:hypothetical protein [Bacteroides fragilis]
FYPVFASLLNFSSIPLPYFTQIKITKIKKSMNYENKQQEEKKEIKKNETDNKQTSDNKSLKSNRGRKKEKPIQGIVLKHYECLKLLITLYQNGAMGIKKETSQIALARYINDKKLLGNIRNGIFIPLKLSTILKEINTIWNETLQDKSIGIK